MTCRVLQSYLLNVSVTMMSVVILNVLARLDNNNNQSLWQFLWNILCHKLTKQSRAEQSRAEQSRAEQSRAEQSRAEQSRAEQSRAEQSRAKQSNLQSTLAPNLPHPLNMFDYLL